MRRAGCGTALVYSTLWFAWSHGWVQDAGCGMQDAGCGMQDASKGSKSPGYQYKTLDPRLSQIAQEKS